MIDSQKIKGNAKKNIGKKWSGGISTGTWLYGIKFWLWTCCRATGGHQFDQESIRNGRYIF
jgi:hypothetical protein